MPATGCPACGGAVWLTHTCDEHNPTAWTGPAQPTKRVGSWLRTLCRSSTAGRRSPRDPAVPCVADARRDMHDEMRRTHGLARWGVRARRQRTPPLRPARAPWTLLHWLRPKCAG